MLNDDAILDASVLYIEEEVLAEFKESCEAEAESPGQHTERLTGNRDSNRAIDSGNGTTNGTKGGHDGPPLLQNR
jgi:hypothetical protein